MKYKLLMVVTFLFGLSPNLSLGTELGDLATSMAVGTWTKLNTNGFTKNYLLYPNGPNTHPTTNFLGEVSWDPVTKKVFFLGAGHFNYSQLHVYSESTNTWTRGQEPPGAPIQLGHGYSHNALSVGDRVLGFLHSNPNKLTFYQYNIGANTWTKHSSTSNDGGIAHAMTYFPDRSKWYVADGTFGRILEYDHISDSWGTVEIEPDCFGTESGGYYHQFGSYNAARKEIVFGGGNVYSGNNKFSKSWCKMDKDGDITLMPEAPHTLRIPEGTTSTKGALVSIDPASGDLLVLTQIGTFFAFNFSTNEWTAIQDQATRPNVFKQTSNNVTNGFVVPISTYGVTMYADHNNNPTLWLYKHAQGGTVVTPPAADTTPPSVPTNLSGSATSSSTASMNWNASNDNVGVAGYQVLRNNTSVATPSGTSFNDTGLVPDTTYSYSVKAFDSAGNFSAASSSISITTPSESTGGGSGGSSGSGGSGGQSSNTASNVLVIHDTSGDSQSNRPVSLARPFRKGDIQNFAQAVIDGTPVLTQNDVKNRWPDGSLKFAIISFVIPNLSSNGSVEVKLVNQSSSHNTGFLSKSDMLNSNYNFDGTIRMAGAATKSISARQILENGHFRYWLKGPIVTAVILEDRMPTRTYDQDFGDGSKALHPIFEAWFYPQGKKVQLGYTVENLWSSSTASKSMRDLRYSLTLTSGLSSPKTEFTHASFNHIARSRWHKLYWLGADPGGVRIDHNLAYLVTTAAIPHYDTSINVSPSLEGNLYNEYGKYDGTFDGSDGGNTNKLGLYKKSLNSTGASYWIGLQATWETTWLYSMSMRGWEMVLGNADLGSRMPIFYREADELAGSGDYFDQRYTQNAKLASAGQKQGTGTVNTFGRPISVNARRFVDLGSPHSSSQSAADKIKTGTISTDGWNQTDSSHHTDICYTAYLFSGRYYYLDCLQMEAAFRVGWKTPGFNSPFGRPGEVGLFNGSNVRHDAWSWKNVMYAAFISPDGQPEQAYFLQSLKDNISEWEGLLNLPATYTNRPEVWNYGRQTRSSNCNLIGNCIQGNFGPSPFGEFTVGGTPFIDNAYMDGNLVNSGISPFELNFLIAGLAMGRNMGIVKPDTLLKYFAIMRFNLTLNPDAYVGSPSEGIPLGPYAMEVYKFPTIVKATNAWPSSWSQLASLFQTNPSAHGGQARTHSPVFGWRGENGRAGLSPDHSYRLIARASLAALYPYTVDGYTGQQAWNYFLSVAPDDTNDLETRSPKWAITPMNVSGNGGGSSGTPDTTPPSPPRNLVVQ